MHARDMRDFASEHAMLGVTVVSALAIVLAATVLMIAGNAGFSAAAQPALVTAPSATSAEQIQFLEDNIFTISGAYVEPMSYEQIRFLEDNVFTISGAYVEPMSYQKMKFIEENTILGSESATLPPHTLSRFQADY
jgi:polysaccharide pyruvyl transferase WcaK-like protein